MTYVSFLTLTQIMMYNEYAVYEINKPLEK